MSQRYEMNVEIREFDPEKSEDIQKAATGEWDFGEWSEYN